MEIKKVEKKIKVEYPKINEMSNKIIKYSIPNKWIKLGVTSFLFNSLMQSKVFATDFEDLDSVIIAGSAPNYDRMRVYDCISVITLIAASAFIISSIMFIINKIKAKKQGGNIKVSKKIKMLFIISIILFILSIIGFWIVDYL